MSPIEPPPNTPVTSILPTEPLLLMGAGPVPIPQAVAQANGVIINHLGPTMDRVIQNVKQMAAYAFQTRSSRILGLAGPGSAAMEMAVSNTCWPGRRVLCLKSGTFSGRLGEMAEGVGASVTYLESEPGRPTSAAAFRPSKGEQPPMVWSGSEESVCPATRAVGRRPPPTCGLGPVPRSQKRRTRSTMPPRG